jgi:VanZ family protein
MRPAALWGPAIAQMGLIFVLSGIPNLTQLPGDLSDHAGHAVGYAILAAAVLRATSGGTWAGVSGVAAMQAWLFTVGYGITDELHQRLVPGRTSALDDVLADAAGAAVALVVILVGASGSRREGREV